MDAGYSPSLFYNSTIGEINDMLASSLRKQKVAQKQQLTYNYILAQQIAECVAASMTKGAKVKTLHEQFPDVFEDEIEEIREKEAQRQAELNKIKFMHFVLSHNARKKGGEAN